jgi:hypothetical protein
MLLKHIYHLIVNTFIKNRVYDFDFVQYFNFMMNKRLTRTKQTKTHCQITNW